MRRTEAVDRNSHLTEIGGALSAPGCLARVLNPTEGQGNQDSDDREDDEQLDEGETRHVCDRRPEPSPTHLRRSRGLHGIVLSLEFCETESGCGA